MLENLIEKAIMWVRGLEEETFRNINAWKL